MSKLRLIFYLVLILLINSIQATNVKALIYSIDDNIYIPLLYSFNKYAEDNNLNVTLTFTSLTNHNTTSYVNNYGLVIDSLLQKKTNKYDLFFYYSAHSKKYGPYLENLDELLPREHIQMFDPEILSTSCIYDNKTVGLPFAVYITTLYSNNDLLTKYNMPIPKTWDELLQTGKLIYNNELNENNDDTDLIPYNGLFNDGDYGILSIYEMINSYRDSNSSPYPETKSDATIEALKMMKSLKEELDPKFYFQMKEKYTIERTNTGEAIFLKFWYKKHNPVFNTTAIPGGKPGVSGSIMSAYNMGINRFSTSDKKKAAAEVIKYMTSKKIQREYMIAQHVFSGIESLYQEKEVCDIVNCEIIKQAKPFSTMHFTTNHYDMDHYMEKYRNYIYEYLYGNHSIDEVLDSIIEMTKHTTFTIKGSNTIYGLGILIVFIIFSIIIPLSAIFLFMDDFRYQFRILSNTIWIISLIGCFILLCSVLTMFGDVTVLKCKLRTITITFGLTISLLPILYILIVNFPEDNEITYWINNNKYNFFIIVILISTILNIILLFAPFGITQVTMTDGRTFEKCLIYESFGKITFHLTLFLEVFMILYVLLLIFNDWNVREIYYETRLFLATMMIDILNIFLYNVFCNINIINNVLYSTIISVILLMFSISNYLFIYGIRILIGLIRKKPRYIEKGKIIKKHNSINKNNYDDHNNSSIRSSCTITKSNSDF